MPKTVQLKDIERLTHELLGKSKQHIAPKFDGISENEADANPTGRAFLLMQLLKHGWPKKSPFAICVLFFLA